MESSAGVEVEWVMTADSAQVVGNKLYVLGGGWDSLTINSVPAQHAMAVAISIKVPWHETNQKHKFAMDVATEDGASLAKAGGEFDVGRPPGIHPGMSQRLQVTLQLALKLEKTGVYSIVVTLDGREAARTLFNVVPGPGIPARKAA
ncbi:MAG: hypothetical protein HY675_08085 [Chloroflexi bacterium]|nr:hypothetical protein [Chloroflexota bacterium]